MFLLKKCVASSSRLDTLSFSLKLLFSISLPPSLHFHSFLFTLNPDCSLNNFFFECISDYLFWKLLLQFCPDLLLDSLSLKTIFPHVAFPLSPSSKLLFTFNPDCSWKLFSFAFIPDCILKICLYDFVLDCCVELIVENSSSVFSLPPLSPISKLGVSGLAELTCMASTACQHWIMIHFVWIKSKDNQTVLQYRKEKKICCTTPTFCLKEVPFPHKDQDNSVLSLGGPSL